MQIARSVLPDLIILDVRTRPSGYEICWALKTSRPVQHQDTYHTGYGGGGGRGIRELRSRELGADWYLAEPFGGPPFRKEARLFD